MVVALVLEAAVVLLDEADEPLGSSTSGTGS